MKNIFEDVNDVELIEIFKDYLGSKELGCSVKSFQKYAIQLKNTYLSTVSGAYSDCVIIVQRMFFEEIARRYVNLYMLNKEDNH